MVLFSNMKRSSTKCQNVGGSKAYLVMFLLLYFWFLFFLSVLSALTDYKAFVFTPGINKCSCYLDFDWISIYKLGKRSWWPCQKTMRSAPEALLKVDPIKASLGYF